MTRDTIILLDHGSAVSTDDDALETLAARLAEKTAATVICAHMSGASPSLAEAVDRAVAAGASRVVVAPCFLSSGRHVRETIPALAAEAASAHPTVELTLAEPLGFDPAMAEVLARRVAPHLDQRGRR